MEGILRILENGERGWGFLARKAKQSKAKQSKAKPQSGEMRRDGLLLAGSWMDMESIELEKLKQVIWLENHFLGIFKHRDFRIGRGGNVIMLT